MARIILHEPLIDWWLTPTLAVFQLYRGVIVNGHTLQYAMQQTTVLFRISNSFCLKSNWRKRKIQECLIKD
jgi:hypothetical protein